MIRMFLLGIPFEPALAGITANIFIEVNLRYINVCFIFLIISSCCSHLAVFLLNYLLFE